MTRLTGADIEAAIADAQPLLDPRLSEVDWDAVAAALTPEEPHLAGGSKCHPCPELSCMACDGGDPAQAHAAFVGAYRVGAAPSPVDAVLAALDAVLLAEALDNLGGMWSWNDAYLDDPAHAHLWVVRAGRILREMVGRPARQPRSGSPAEAREDGETRAAKEAGWHQQS